MNVIKKTMVFGIALLSVAAPAFADTLERGKHSNFAVWAFLALCALIVVAQVLPLARNLTTGTAGTEMALEKSQEKQQQRAL